MNRWKKLFALFLTGAVLITGDTLSHKNEVTAAEEKYYGISNPRAEKGVITWDKIKFGSYYQDMETQPKEPIKWRVLSVNGDDAFLLADKNLDSRPYNEINEAVTWETCTLRKWLNEEFYNEAFDPEEKEAVRETTIVNENNPYDDTDSGNDTKDKVYLMSISEAGNTNYGFDVEFNKSSKTRESKNTDYAKVNNAYSSTGSGTDGNGDWWLRSPGGGSISASYVSYNGNGNIFGEYVFDRENAVRPVIHINLSSSKVIDAGEVNSEGSVTALADGINPPRVKDGVTTWDCVYFGSYIQNCTFEKKPLEWRVLSVDGDDAFLLADKNLDCKPCNEERKGVTWVTCTLRKWLNEDFYNEAFDEEEKKCVIETTVANKGIPYNEIKDKVYLLSISEAGNTDYGFDAALNESSNTRESKSTDYARLNGARSGEDGNGDWWLRSISGDVSSASCVCYDGYIYEYSMAVSNNRFAVRPALHINLSSSLWSKAGEVTGVRNSEPEPSDNSEPALTVKPTATQKPIVTVGPTKKPAETPLPTVTSEPTKKPAETPLPTVTSEPTKKPEKTTEPDVTKKPSEPAQTPFVTAPPAPLLPAQSPLPSDAPLLKKLKVTNVRCVKNANKITGKVSVPKTTVRIKVGSKAYKKATVKGRKFTLKFNYRLKKTKVIVKVTKKGCKDFVKSFKVK